MLHYSNHTPLLSQPMMSIVDTPPGGSIVIRPKLPASRLSAKSDVHSRNADSLPQKRALSSLVQIPGNFTTFFLTSVNWNDPQNGSVFCFMIADFRQSSLRPDVLFL